MRRYITALVTLAAVLALGATPASAETYVTYDGSRGYANAQTGTITAFSFPGFTSGKSGVYVDRSFQAGVYHVRAEFASQQVHINQGANLCLRATYFSHCMTLATGAAVPIESYLAVNIYLSGPSEIEVSLESGAGNGYGVVKVVSITATKTS